MRGVIIVDDSKPDRYLVRRTLEEIGFDRNVVELKGGGDLVALVSDPKRLRAECGSWPAPILVLLDINMPGMSGFEAVDALEELAAAGTIDADGFDITIFSSSSDASDMDEAQRHPMIRNYLVKPTMPEDLTRVLERSCRA